MTDTNASLVISTRTQNLTTHTATGRGFASEVKEAHLTPYASAFGPGWVRLR